MLLRTETPLPYLVSPTETAQKRWVDYVSKPIKEPRVLLGDNFAEKIGAQYGPQFAHVPWLYEGVFQVPLGTTPSALERACKQAARAFFETYRKKGFDVLTDRKVQFYPGIYPSIDLVTNQAKPDYRDYIVRAWFVKRKPETYRLWLPLHLREDVIPGANL